MPKKMELYEVNNALDDISLECSLVRTLRVKYTKRAEARTWICGTKWIVEVIRELKTFRHN